ncbi:MAG: hypothetical protein ACYTXY_32705, partial [Nostoc sp.]
MGVAATIVLPIVESGSSLGVAALEASIWILAKPLVKIMTKNTTKLKENIRNCLCNLNVLGLLLEI